MRQLPMSATVQVNGNNWHALVFLDWWKFLQRTRGKRVQNGGQKVQWRICANVPWFKPETYTKHSVTGSFNQQSCGAWFCVSSSRIKNPHVPQGKRLDCTPGVFELHNLKCNEWLCTLEWTHQPAHCTASSMGLVTSTKSYCRTLAALPTEKESKLSPGLSWSGLLDSAKSFLACNAHKKIGLLVTVEAGHGSQ